MALYLRGGNSDESIRMLGRWKSTAFLNYIRPQVLEWAGDTSRTMAETKEFLDVGEKEPHSKEARLPMSNSIIEGEFPSFTHLST